MSSSWPGTSPRKSWTSKRSTRPKVATGSSPSPNRWCCRPHDPLVSTARPKILVTSPVVPWPEVSGSCIRAAATIRGLASIADVDVFVLHPDAAQPAELPSYATVERWSGAAPGERHGVGRYAWIMERHVPPELATVDYTAVRETFQQWRRPQYD